MRATADDGTVVDLNPDGTWVAVSPVPALSPDSAGFRRVPWGASRAQVKTLETSGLDHETATYLAYDLSIAGLSALGIYLFAGDVLVRGKYVVTETYQNYVHHLTNFDALKKLLEKKYGEPRDDQSFWTGDLYKDDFMQWGMAAATGEYSRFINWTTDDSEVSLSLSGENFEVRLHLEYASRAHDGMEEAMLEANHLQDL